MLKYILFFLLLTTPVFADNVRVQVLTGGDALYYPMDKYCTPEQVTAILAIVNTTPEAIESEKARRVEEQVKAQIEAAKIVPKEPTKEDLQAVVASLESQRAEIDFQIADTQAKIITAKPKEEIIK
jgi:hypothetical protein